VSTIIGELFSGAHVFKVSTINIMCNC